MEVTVIALKKKPQATKCSDHRTINLIAHTAKIVTKILRRRIEKKIEDVLGEDQFGFRRGKGTRDAIRMLRIISEQTLEIDEELSVCFVDWQKAFDRVSWPRMLFVTNSFQLIQRMHYQGGSGRVWRLQNRRANHSYCEICRRTCVTVMSKL